VALVCDNGWVPIQPSSVQDHVNRAKKRAESIRDQGLDIYTCVETIDPSLFFPDKELAVYLEFSLRGRELGGPIRTRSKLAKQMVASALGYGTPASFRRTRPRFPGQDLDIHVQQDNNLQIWNQDISPEQRYVLIRPNSNDIVQSVRVVRGQQVALWDRTGTLTSKFQAKRRPGRAKSLLVSSSDTEVFVRTFDPKRLPGGVLLRTLSSQPPKAGLVMPIDQIFERAVNLIGTRLQATRASQDRIRGELLQQRISDELGIGEYANFGQWPDIVSQAIEVKLQTSPTIDLGLVLPNDKARARSLGLLVRHCDARYVIVYGEALDSGEVELHTVVASTGSDFFKEFVQFGGLVQNHKRQIRLPNDLF
jgi:hypothetical protein